MNIDNLKNRPYPFSYGGRQSNILADYFKILVEHGIRVKLQSGKELAIQGRGPDQMRADIFGMLRSHGAAWLKDILVSYDLENVPGLEIGQYTFYRKINALTGQVTDWEGMDITDGSGCGAVPGVDIFFLSPDLHAAIEAHCICTFATLVQSYDIICSLAKVVETERGDSNALSRERHAKLIWPDGS